MYLYNTHYKRLLYETYREDALPQFGFVLFMSLYMKLLYIYANIKRGRVCYFVCLFVRKLLETFEKSFYSYNIMPGGQCMLNKEVRYSQKEKGTNWVKRGGLHVCLYTMFLTNYI